MDEKIMEKIEVPPMENPIDQMMVDKSAILAYEDRIKELNKKIEGLETAQKTMVPMILSFQNYIDNPPLSKQQMYTQSCSSDGVTVAAWRVKWLDHIKQNAAKYDFNANSAMEQYKKFAYKPCIVAGSGPSLKRNIKILAKERDPENIGLVSCLHNFAYFMDNDIHPTCFINLDAGDITIPEMSQGGTQPEQFYWDATKNETLVTSVVGKPELIQRWQGKVLFFDSPVPDPVYMADRNKLIDFELYYDVGGNAMGAAYYHARAILGGMPIVFIGADFSFSYMHKFHSFDTPYDQQFSGVIPCTDIFGNRVYTWQSYYNFKCWFDSQSMGGQGNMPVQFINCTEGGILGAYMTGNIRSIQQMSLNDFFVMYNHHKMVPGLIHKDPTKPKLLF